MRTSLKHKEGEDLGEAAFCSAIDEGDASPDVVDFDEEEFIAEMKAKWREEDDKEDHK